MKTLAFCAAVAAVGAVAFVVLASALMWSTAAELGRAVVLALGRATQWAPR